MTQRVAPPSERRRPDPRSFERANRRAALENAARPARYESLFELDQTGCARSHLAIDHGAPAPGVLPAASAPLGAAGDRLVVVHVVPPTLTRDPTFIPRFTARATAVLGMSHPNLVRTLDFVADGQRCHWVSEFIQGHTLASLLGKKRGEERALTLRQHLTILCEVLRGLEHAHRLVDADGVPSPIVYHHLSPSSVLVSYEGQVKVTDAVLCAVPAVTGGRFDEEAERLAYRAPECSKGGMGDPRSDIFAVGALLWEAVCGRPRPVGASLDQAREMCQRAAEPEFEGAGASVSPTLIAITRRALAKDPGERYQTAREFLLALEAQMPLVPASRDRGSLFAFMCSHFYEEHAALQRLLELRTPAVFGGGSEADADAEHGDPALTAPAELPGSSRRAHRLLRGALALTLAVGAVFAFFIVRPEHGSRRGPETIVQSLRPVGAPAEVANPPRVETIGAIEASSPVPSAPPAPAAASDRRAGVGGSAGSANDAPAPVRSVDPKPAAAPSQTRSDDFSLAPRTWPEDGEEALEPR